MASDSDSPRRRPPVTVFSGFLGAGKTTVLRRALAQAEGRRWAAVVNDVAAVNVDAALVAEAGAQRVVALGNGCVCCTVRDELAETLAELCATGDYEHVFVETTGVADPRAIARLFTERNAFGRSLSDFAVLSALVTVIDPSAWAAEEQRSRAANGGAPGGVVKPAFELMVEQVECADVLIVNQCDRAAAEVVDAVEQRLRGLNGRAELFRTEQGQLPAELWLDRVRFEAEATLRGARWVRLLTAAEAADGSGRAAERRMVVKRGGGPRSAGTGRHEERFGIGSFVFQARAPFEEAKLREWFAQARPAGLLRAKGFFWVRERPAEMGFVSVAGGAVRFMVAGTWAAALRERGVITEEEIPGAARARWAEPFGDRRQELVFIGVGLPEAAMRAELAECLVKEEAEGLSSAT